MLGTGKEFETVVIGGGPAGIATALSLLQHGRSVAVLERTKYAEARIGETFPPDINPLLARLGLTDVLNSVPRVSSVGIRSVWGSTDVFDQSFLFNPYGNGWHVDRQAFDACLAVEAKRRGAQLIVGAKLLDLFSTENAGWTLHVVLNGKPVQLRASFVVDATNRASTVARRLGARRKVYDNLIGVSALFERGPDHNTPEALLIEAVQDGWWYSAPLPNHQLVVTFMTDSDLCDHTLARQELAWTTKMKCAEHTRTRTVRCSPLGSRQAFPANTSRLDIPSGPAWLAVGDAATAQDPLSGNGVCRSLLAGIEAGETIHASLSGDSSAEASYCSAVSHVFDTYMQQRSAYYAWESRWALSPFWARRVSTTSRPLFTRPSAMREPGLQGTSETQCGREMGDSAGTVEGWEHRRDVQQGRRSSQSVVPPER